MDIKDPFYQLHLGSEDSIPDYVALTQEKQSLKLQQALYSENCVTTLQKVFKNDEIL